MATQLKFPHHAGSTNFNGAQEASKHLLLCSQPGHGLGSKGVAVRELCLSSHDRDIYQMIGFLKYGNLVEVAMIGIYAK